MISGWHNARVWWWFLLLTTFLFILQGTISCPHERKLLSSAMCTVAYGDCEGEKVIYGDCQD